MLDIHDSLSFIENTIKAPIWNTTGEEVTFDMGYAIKNENGSLTIINSLLSKVLQKDYYTNYSFDLSKANLSDGTYHIYPVIKRPNGTEWKTLNKDYFLVSIKNGNISISIQKPTYELSFKSCTLISNGYTDTAQELSTEIENNGIDEYYGWLYLFIEGTDKYLARTGATVSVGKQNDIRFFFTPTAGGTFRIWIATDENGENKIGEGTIELKVREKKVYVTLTPRNTRTENGVLYMMSTNFYVDLSILNNTDKEVTFSAYANLVGPNVNKVWNINRDISAGVTKKVGFYSSNPLQEGTTYTLYLYKDDTKTDSWQDPITFTVSTSTGIQSVTDNIQEKEPVYYDLQGRIVLHPTKGIYIVNKKKVIIK